MKRVILLSVLILLISLGYSFAEVPCKINYQGRLIKDNVPVDGTKTMVFSIYGDAVGPPLLWTSGDVNIEVHNGLFKYVIGSDGGDLSGIDWTAGQELYLEVKIETDILTPREELYAYPYAINSHLLEGATKEYFLNISGETQKKDGGLNIMGNVGIGTTSPGARLDVQGGPNNAQGGISLGTLNAQSGWVSSPEDLNFVVDNTNRIQERSFLFRDGTAGNVLMMIQENGNVGIGTTSPGAKLDVNGEIKCSGFADHFGMNWHEAVAEKHNSVGWATAVDYSGPGVLLYVQAYGRWLEPLNNRLRITIDGEVWRDYTGLARIVGANGWNVLDDTGDNNSGVITLMPFKKFSSGLKVEIYNAYSNSESSVRVNYLTP